MSLGCAMCGNCCEDIVVDKQHADTANLWWVYWQNGGKVNTRTRNPFWLNIRFIANHWAETKRDGDTVVHRCEMFDPETRACTAHDERPPLCREYPWYGVDNASDDRLIRKQAMAVRARQIERNCSFQLDIPREDRPENSRPLIPIRAV